MSDEHLYDDPPTTLTPVRPVTVAKETLREFAARVRRVSRNAVKVRQLCDEVLKDE